MSFNDEKTSLIGRRSQSSGNFYGAMLDNQGQDGVNIPIPAPVGRASSSSGVELRRFSASSIPSSYMLESATEPIIVREKRSGTIDEFNSENGPPDLKLSNIAKALRTGRQRKKTAARTKGGEFQARRKKRRVYFCCISNNIDVEALADEFQVAHFGMKGQMYDEVLHLHLANLDDISPTAAACAVDTLYGEPLSRINSADMSVVQSPPPPPVLQPSSSGMFAVRQPLSVAKMHPSFEVSYKEDTLLGDMDEGRDLLKRSGGSFSHKSSFEEEGYDTSVQEAEMSPVDRKRADMDEYNPTNGIAMGLPEDPNLNPLQKKFADSTAAVASTVDMEHSKEVFVFGFGAIVYWGLAKSEVQELLQFIEKFIVKERLSKEEFEAGEDDMAFVTDFDRTDLTIANDVITLPPATSVKERLAVSFAIAQSAVLTIFEARVERKIEEYKYIPEALAESGKVKLSPKQLGVMIGEVFVMQHDVNLHSEILDLPDYFWKEHTVEPLYRMTLDYMEMVPRISVLNKRLDLLRQLLRVLQQQHENAHSVKLEWIVIWLIVISCVLEMWDIIKDVFGIQFGNEE